MRLPIVVYRWDCDVFCQLVEQHVLSGLTPQLLLEIVKNCGEGRDPVRALIKCGDGLAEREHKVSNERRSAGVRAVGSEGFIVEYLDLYPYTDQYWVYWGRYSPRRLAVGAAIRNRALLTG